jgi:hypothetical protein
VRGGVHLMQREGTVHPLSGHDHRDAAHQLELERVAVDASEQGGGWWQGSMAVGEGPWVVVSPMAGGEGPWVVVRAHGWW